MGAKPDGFAPLTHPRSVPAAVPFSEQLTGRACRDISTQGLPRGPRSRVERPGAGSPNGHLSKSEAGSVGSRVALLSAYPSNDLIRCDVDQQDSAAGLPPDPREDGASPGDGPQHHGGAERIVTVNFSMRGRAERTRRWVVSIS